jgi:hypothetical protein
MRTVFRVLFAFPLVLLVLLAAVLGLIELLVLTGTSLVERFLAAVAARGGGSQKGVHFTVNHFRLERR